MPGLKVFFPATPYDAKGMMNLALRGTDPVIFFESQRLYAEPEIFVAGGVPVDYYEVPLGEPAMRKVGQRPDDHHRGRHALPGPGGGQGAGESTASPPR